ncbi:permease prefix domain 1-containing protein [Microbacterium aoyamense]|uniref:Permease prefix domain 1-containing protein n=1 Tax=Microbacterium aoyamense TaxID=344166 RepID=A0ABP5ANA6_9MICO|nr:permease prefix domain 1-containing protein [Microbacterium aoyamense]
MNATLTDRYVDAATRSVPENQRAEIAAELRERIADQLDARLEAGQPHDSAERAVLTELGDPDKLAAGYTDRKLYLIGPRYYLDWWRLLKLLWAIVPACAVFGVALGMTLAGEPFGDIVGSVFAVLISTIVHVGFWVTLVFFIVERSGSKAPMSGEWTPDSLPEPREKGTTFGEMIASIVFLVLAAGAVVWDHFIGFAPSEPGLSFLDPGLWPWWVFLLFLVMAVEAMLAVLVYVVGRWTIAFAVLNTVLALAVAVPALVLLVQGTLINPEFFSTVIPEDSAATVASVVSTVTGFVIAGVAAWDILDGFLKALRARR